MPISAQRSSERVVVLLRPKEKKRLERLARTENVSSAEIVRRSLNLYPEAETGVDDKLLAEMNHVLDQTLESVRSARIEVHETLEKIHRMRAKRA